MERSKVTQNIEKCHRQIDKLKAILLLMECAVLEDNKEDMKYYRKRYAEALQAMCAPHIEAMDNFKIMEESFKCMVKIVDEIPY